MSTTTDQSPLILLGNTGRGGELAIFTAIVKAYRNKFPNAYIRIITCYNDVYDSIFKNSPDIDKWVELKYRNEVGKVIKHPVSAMNEYFDAVRGDFDIIEYPCEYDLSPAFGKVAFVRPAIINCYSHIKQKSFSLDDITRRVFIYPTDEERKFADDLFAKYGDDLVLISYVANSAAPVIPLSGYETLCNKIAKYRPVAYTARKDGHEMKGHIDLRGITFSQVFAIAEKLKYFVGPDTAITWIVANMPGMLIVIRGGGLYPIENTGLVANKFRTIDNTYEMNFVKNDVKSIHDKVLTLLKT